MKLHKMSERGFVDYCTELQKQRILESQAFHVPLHLSYPPEVQREIKRRKLERNIQPQD